MSLRWSSATDQLYAVSNSSPSLDLDFASNKSLLDNISGLPLVNHQRDASSSKSAGTYVGSDGLIKTSVVNLQPYSEITVNWTAQGSTLSPDFALAPNGTNAAAQIIPSSGIVEGRIFYPSSLTGQLTASCFFKPNGYNFATIGLFKGSNYASIIVNLLTGEVTAVSSGAVPEAYSVTDAGNGWKRLSVTTTTVNSYVSLGAAPDASTTLNTFGLVDAATFDGTSGVLAWGAQLEEGSTVNTYVTTTNLPSAAPRFDHDPVTGESLGLLIEESRTNYCIDSENPAGWTVTNGASKQTFTAVTAPDGSTLTQGFRLPDGVSRVYPTLSSTGTIVPVSSFYVRSVSGTATLNLFIQGVNVGSNISVPPDRWLRISGTSASNTVTGFSVRGNSSQSEDVYIWGAQLEAGSFATSYIPTSGSTVTRAADVASIAGTNFSSWYNQSEGTVFVDTQSYPHPVSGKALVPFAFSDNSYSNRITLSGSTGSSQFNFDVTAGGILQRAVLGNFLSSGLKAAGGYKSTGSAGSLDGATAVTSNSPNIPSVISQLDIGQAQDGTNTLNGHISRLAYYPYRLSDTILQEITS